MTNGSHTMLNRVNCQIDDDGVTNLVEYLMISGILLLLMMVLMFSVNDVFMEGPANTLSYHAFTDIGNGISARIVDLYIIAPGVPNTGSKGEGTITTFFNLPDDVAGRDYTIEAILGSTDEYGADQVIEVRHGFIYSRTAIAGIGASAGVSGNTTGRGWNRIYYNSSGV